MATETEKELLHCNFCNKSQREVKKLIAGPTVFICDECVDICLDIIAEDRELEAKREKENARQGPPTPREIATRLSKSIVGNDEAKRAISVAVYNHYKRNASPEKHRIEKSNLLLIGPTGSGKTLFARSLANIISVPFHIGDATTLTEAGYVGEDVESLLLGLLQNADSDLQRAEQGIIFIDEIDKLRRSRGNVSITRDVSGEGVQQALLKIIEGTVASIPPKGGRKHPNDEHIRMDTSGILFIAGGSFEGLEEIVRKRMSRIRSGHLELEESRDEVGVGEWPLLSMTGEMALKEVTADDLIEFGLIPEFAGRLHTIVTLAAPDREAMVRILVEPEDSIVNQYKKRFADEAVTLQVSEDGLWHVADLALAKRSGARGLRSIFESCLRDVMYDLPSHRGIARCIVTAETLRTGRPLLFDGEGQPVLERKHLFVANGPRGRHWGSRIEAMLAGLDGILIFTSNDRTSADVRTNAGRKALASTKVALLLIDDDYLKADESVRPELGYFIECAKRGSVNVRWILIDHCDSGLLDLVAESAPCWLDLPLSSLTPGEQNEVLYQICEEVTRLALDLQLDAPSPAVADGASPLNSSATASPPAVETSGNEPHPPAPESASNIRPPEGKKVNLDWL